MQAVLIVNPTAGKEKATTYANELKEKLQAKYEEVLIEETAKEGDGERLAIKHQRADLLVSMGGDGTLSEIINGIAPLEKRPTLAFIPLGTVNELARVLNMPMSPEEVIEEILTYTPRALDLGKIEDRYFSNSITVGTIPEAMHDVSSSAKTMFGSFAFIAKGAKTLLQNENYHFKLTYDEGDWQGEASVIMIGLTSYIAGFEHFFPKAKENDGLLHGMIIPELGFQEVVKMAPDLWKGNIEQSAHVDMFTTTKIHIEAEESLETNVNGDPGPTLPVTVEVLPSYLSVLAPTHQK